MKAATITANGSPQRLADSFSIPPQVKWIYVQNPASNSDLFVGQADHQPFIISEDTDRLFPEDSLKNVYIKGTNTETYVVLVG